MTTPQDPDPRDEPAPEPAEPRATGGLPPAPKLSDHELSGTGPFGDHSPVPTEVRVSFWALAVAAVISVLGAALALGGRDVAVDQIRHNPAAKNFTEDQIQGYATASLVAAIIISLIFAALYLLCAFRVRDGRNWARVLVTVLTVLKLLGAALGASLLSLVSLLAAVIGVMLLYLPASREFFAARRVR